MSLRVDWKAPHTRRLCVSYAQDWVLVVIMAAIFYGIDKVQPYHREFSLQDKSLMYTHAPEDTVPMWAVYILCLVAPIIFIAIGSLGFRRSVADFHHGVLGLCLGLSLCCMLTVAIKVTTGRPRPDLIDRCQPRPGAADPPLGLSNYTICTTPMDTYEMIDGFKSFPSGHSSFSFAGLAYLSFYLAGKMRLFDGRGHTYKGFIFAIPLLGATLVAISRTRDYRHHWQDVFIGSLLGIACAYFAYRQYHPPLYDLHCHKAYHIRFAPSSNSRADHYLNNNPGNLEAGIAGDSSRLLVDDTLQSRDAHYSQYQDNGYSGESRSPVNIQTYDNNSNKL